MANNNNLYAYMYSWIKRKLGCKKKILFAFKTIVVAMLYPHLGLELFFVAFSSPNP